MKHLILLSLLAATMHVYPAHNAAAAHLVPTTETDIKIIVDQDTDVLPAVPRTPSPDVGHFQPSAVQQQAQAQLIPILYQLFNRTRHFPKELLTLIAAWWGPTTFKVVNCIDSDATFWFGLPTEFVVGTQALSVKSPGIASELNHKESAELVFSGGDEQLVNFGFTNPNNPLDMRTMTISLRLRDVAYKPRTIEISDVAGDQPPAGDAPEHKITAKCLVAGTQGTVLASFSFADSPAPKLPTFVSRAS